MYLVPMDIWRVGNTEQYKGMTLMLTQELAIKQTAVQNCLTARVCFCSIYGLLLLTTNQVNKTQVKVVLSSTSVTIFNGSNRGNDERTFPPRRHCASFCSPSCYTGVKHAGVASVCAFGCYMRMAREWEPAACELLPRHPRPLAPSARCVSQQLNKLSRTPHIKHCANG